MDRRWVKVFLSSLGKIKYQVGVKKNLVKTLLSFEHNASFVEDCECLFRKVNNLIVVSDILSNIKDDMNKSFCKLDYTKKRILFLRHKKNMEYNDIANEVGIKVRERYSINIIKQLI